MYVCRHAPRCRRRTEQVNTDSSDAGGTEPSEKQDAERERERDQKLRSHEEGDYYY